MRCVRSVKYSFSLNGDIVGNVTPSRGLRQGDPLSPYLFVLCAHGLSCALLTLEEKRLLTGVRIATSCPTISHLFFADDSLLFFRATMSECEAIRNCLLTYEKASGQLINFEKSSLSFSPNTDGQLAENIKSKLAITMVKGHEIYLGLPVFSTRHKKLQFRYLVEKVAQRIQGWGNRYFSVGGKETLIKSVLQSIPTYAMSCFRIPISVCEEVERECANFWWGVDEGRKRMHWKSWKALCKPKCMGGMGFRHLETFNKSLLAKQIWRIMLDPGSLVARVLKARYFRHQDIMEAGLGSNPSYVWRSLFWSRSLLKNGLCWRVGDGTKIDLHKASWIPSCRGSSTPPREGENHMKVSSLIEDGHWKEELVKQLFSSHLVDEILAIPIPPIPQVDYRFWLFDQKGKYTVRDGYKLALGFYDSPVSSSSNPLKSWWKFLWTLSIPPKVRIFCWRAVHNILPTGQNLIEHHVPVDGVCPLCHSSCDSTCHALFSCPVLKPCWKGSSFWVLLKQVYHLEVLDIFMWMKERLSISDFEAFSMRTWATWNERLCLVHTGKKSSHRDIASWGETLLHEYQKASFALPLASPFTQCKSPWIWTAPPPHKLRLDVDAAYNERANRFAFGGVIRNHEGQPLLAFGRKLDKPLSITYAELLAIEGGLKISQVHNLQVHLVTSDSLLAVQAVTRPEEDISYVGSLAKNIKLILDSQDNISLSHVRRSANVVAHPIAAFAISSPSHFVWAVGDFPFWLIQLVTKDLIDSQ